MSDHGGLPVREIRPSYMRQPLLDFLYTVQSEPDHALVVFDWLPYMQRDDDGTHGPPRIPLGRIREELLIRAAFPHEAQTAVW